MGTRAETVMGIIDDCICSIQANVRPILVLQNQWLFSKHIYGGISCVINDILSNNQKQIELYKKEGRTYALQQLENREIPDGFIDIARNSKYWNMGYDDLIPIQFATELFDDKNKELLPPAVQLKCQQDEQYWSQIMDESNQVLLLNHDKIIKDNDKKLIENEDDNESKHQETNDNENEIDAIKKFIEISDEAIIDISHNNPQKVTKNKINFCYDNQRHSDTKPKFKLVPVATSD